MIKCSVIIAAYNEEANIKNCLDSVFKIGYPKDDFEVIVVDNNSTDKTPGIIRRFPAAIYLEEKTPGASNARNKGIKTAKGEILIFLDADAIVSENWMRHIVEAFGDEKIGAVGGAIYPIHENYVSLYLGVSLFLRYPRYGAKKEIKGFPSANLAVRKNLAGNGFDIENFSTYGEDKDLCYRISNQGYKIMFLPEAIVYHHHAKTLRELFNLVLKSSAGRAAFGKKYPFAPDILLFNYHVPLVYAALLALALLTGTAVIFLVLALPALLYLVFVDMNSYRESRKFLLSFFIKPVLDVLLLYVIYFAYSVRRYNRM